MPLPPASGPLPPQQVCGYPVIRTLRSTSAVAPSYLALAAGGRRVVLKPLDGDCLLRGQLHPNIRDRLERVRDLAHTGVATLCGVQRDDGGSTDGAGHTRSGGVYLVWEFVEGRSLEEHLTAAAAGKGADHPWQDRVLLARELVLSVESLHALGIVHGAIHGRNVLLDSGDRLRLTHVSPLLYTDPAEDTAAVVSLLQEMAQGEPEPSPLGRRLARLGGRPSSLRELAVLLAGDRAADHEPAAVPPEPPAGAQATTPAAAGGGASPDDGDEARSLRRRALAGATAVAVLAAGGAYGLWRFAHREGLSPAVAPEAPAAAMQVRGDAP